MNPKDHSKEKRKKNYLQMYAYVDKVTPHAVEVEEVVLGAIIIDPKSLDIVLPILKPDLFYKEQHQLITQSILRLFKKKVPVDMITVCEQLKIDGVLEQCGGTYYIALLTNRVASAHNIEYHMRILYQKYLKREIIAYCSTALKRAYDDTVDVFDLLSEVLNDLEALDIHKKETVIKSLQKTLTEMFTAYEEKQKEEVYLTGSEEIDSKLSIDTNSILLVGGKSGSGKTRFISWLMYNMMKINFDTTSILWCNMEDDTPKMLRTFISQETGLTDDQLRQRNYELTPKDEFNIQKAKATLENFDIEFIDTNKSIEEIHKMFYYFCTQRPGRFCILIIDNLMLLKDNSERGQQTEKDDRISLGVKQISIDTNKNGMKSMVIMMHHFTDEQLSKLNLRDAYRPRESHLKGSTRYRDISTKIVLLNRPENFPDLMNAYKHIKDVMKYLFIAEVTKNRNSKVGVIRMFADIGIVKFKEIKLQ